METNDADKPSGIERIEYTSIKSMPDSLFDNTEFGIALARERGVNSQNYSAILSDIDHLIASMNEIRNKVLALAASDNKH